MKYAGSIWNAAHRVALRGAGWLLLGCLALLAIACAPTRVDVAVGTPATAIPVATTVLPAPPPVDTATPASTPSPPAAPSPDAQETTPVYSYRVVNEYPHDPEAFTQGLVYEEGLFYEGTGLEGRSSLRKVALETGEVLQIHNLAPDYFGEGISVVGDRIWQLTWQERVVFLYDKETFEELDTIAYPTEGWGLTYDGERLIMSDGTAMLYFRDPATFELLGTIAVQDRGSPVVRLNELEYVDGRVLANVWQTNRIAIVDPADGQVSAWLDLTGLLGSSGGSRAVDVLNGIAYDAAGERLFVTGKLWPKLFEIEIVGDGATAFLPLVARQ
ncbi:MAG: glutaminyl-peptide cyclotransferase [Anaerolineae bacterium]|nr:glutaminyl-peptide cyclotransferase [Anaerolineae bacterium]